MNWSDVVVRSAISIVIPLYNVEDYIEAAVLSLRAQSFTDFDVVIVNDGSTDQSAEVARAVTHGDARFLVVDQENHGPGPGGGRNGGLAYTRSGHLMFLDSDDALTPDALQHIVQAFEHNPLLDVVTTSAARLCGASVRPSHLHDVSHPWPEANTTAQESPWLMFDSTPWNKAFRREFFDRVVGSWPARQLYEDIAPMTKAMLHAEHIAVLTQAHYLWRVRGAGSITHTQTSVRGDLAQLDQLAIARADVLETASDVLLEWFDWKTLTQDVLWMTKKLPTVSGENRTQLFDAVRDALLPIDKDLVDRTQAPLRKCLTQIIEGDQPGALRQILRHRLALRQDRRTPVQALTRPDHIVSLQHSAADAKRLSLWVTSAAVDLRNSRLEVYQEATWARSERQQPLVTIPCKRATKVTALFEIPTLALPGDLENAFVEIVDQSDVRGELTRSAVSAVKRRLVGTGVSNEGDVQLFIDDARIRITRGVTSPRISRVVQVPGQVELSGASAPGHVDLGSDMSAWLTCPGSNEAIEAQWHSETDGGFRIVLRDELISKLPNDALALSICDNSNPAIPMPLGVGSPLRFRTADGLRGVVSSGQFGQAQLEITRGSAGRLQALGRDIRQLV